MNLPRRCPWCHARYRSVEHFDGQMPSRTVTYDCGIKFSEYPKAVQISTPCLANIRQAQWIRPKRWARILQSSNRKAK